MGVGERIKNLYFHALLGLAERYDVGIDRGEDFGAELHVSVNDIANTCLRQSFYRRLHPELEKRNRCDIKRHGLGKLYHGVNVLSRVSELRLTWRRIVGVIDEYGAVYVPEEDRVYYVLLEKKFGNYPPDKSEPNIEHVRQVLYYYALMRLYGYRIDRLVILYDNPSRYDYEPKVFLVRPEPVKRLLEEMEIRADIIISALEGKTYLPDKEENWRCEKCAYRELCRRGLRGDGYDPRLEKYGLGAEVASQQH